MRVEVYAPASIGNVGVGFDVLGAAISPINGDLLGDRVILEPNHQHQFSLQCIGPFFEKLPPRMEDNIVYGAYLAFVAEMEKQGLPVQSVAMTLEKNMPIGSGLGSSACSIVAALDALNQYHEQALDQQTMLRLMGEMEAAISGSLHYDNVAPCYLGGLQLMLEQNDLISQSIPCFDHWYWVMAYPGIEVATAEARAILPEKYARSDVILHGRHLAGFIHACYTNQAQLAAQMVKDVVAEPYRASLLPGFTQARRYAEDQGALATGISGSGPTLFTISDDLSIAQDLSQWLLKNYIQNEDGFVYICKLDRNGSRCTRMEI